ncbi:bifunctional phosphoribosyl-AMP cyclohydrolase/phosphoribosyl-ATP diphosphatase HisIE [Oceanobacillus alkalisoli]|uniref:bifunctional phosphoribosyl-AMP cyclohydrolase/phosphoribosyl-ATP diphosphatase HisIE n=1 Tax=Oceanobacillus alkalisoli TaxID=2925113 RepID=UPI001EF06350|nr:bifunctional phosphoribosyl-AMP cyclohydrolase/phosphoribosyl-ATP diphosphatase HisIE [Oceanobacillus alkalisoli]MCF3944592.1 bifunctional phosphoribosyl-AMP cyclohydrolase/phosphoribosyl-ATP diphosphatase HisIE [Oceanobacillus alkalisoli]MCG5104779.1 bifunctional phosphoribosyl-AMP cyclohydrolase/phosphoribosyl-ATP diphosphatase HisIE [Oceanobacillus alkalisoli]
MSVQPDDLTYDDKGLLPAIIQDASNGKVLTLAYMNKESLEKTLETGETWFYSRSRETLWNKGETSGNKQIVKEIRYDCDKDALLVQVEPLGSACHTGEDTCFYQTMTETELPIFEIIPQVIAKIKDRRSNPAPGAYTTYLFDKGIDKMLKKVGEESSEVIIAAKNEDKQELTAEISDLLYHLLVVMEESGVALDDIKAELMERHLEKEGQNRE